MNNYPLSKHSALTNYSTPFTMLLRILTQIVLDQYIAIAQIL